VDIRVIRIVAIVLLLASLPFTVQSQGAGVIEGQILNATSDGVPVEGLSTTLWTLDAQQQSMLLQAVTDGEGRVRFPDLDTQAFSYQLQAEYQGVSYWSDVQAFSEGENLLALTVEVYDSTTSDADVWVERAHWILDIQAGAIQAQELQILFNGGTETYVGSGGHTAHFYLPLGATDLQLTERLMACCIEQTEGGFVYTQPILPGEHDFFFSYLLPYRSGSQTLSKEIIYPIHNLDVMVADTGVSVTGPGLTAQEPLSIEGRRYLHLSAQDLAPGDGLTLHLASLPLAGTPSEPRTATSPMLVRAVIGLGTLATILALGYPFLRTRQGEES
jgi:5-hydroxyisourate hydrolase-like protein (transthyretin family)